MNLTTYQNEIARFDQSPTVNRPTYYMVGMADELMEVATAILRYENDKSLDNVVKIQHELGDFLWYFTRYASSQDVNIDEIPFKVSYASSLFINSAVLGYLQLASALQVVAGFEKKIMRGDAQVEFNAVESLTYIYNMFSILVSVFGLSVEDLAERNYNKLQDRLDRNVIKGSGDDR